MPTYITFAQFETSVGGPDSLALIADPTFSNNLANVDLVNEAIEWAEGELLRCCRAAPKAANLASWVDTPANLPTSGKEAIVTLAIFHLHEIIRGTQGIAIPKGSIDSKDKVYTSLQGLTDGSVSWNPSATPAKSLTQKVRVYTDPNGGRRASTGQVRKLIGS